MCVFLSACVQEYMSVSVWTSVYTCLGVDMCVYLSLFGHVYMFLSLLTVYVNICVHTYLCMSLDGYMYMYISVSVCLCVGMCVCFSLC